jgi:SET and MYND domain-containing protein 4
MEGQSRKCSEKSSKFIIEGDDSSAESRFFDAIISYNKALCFAPKKSSEIFSGFLSRSKVFLRLKKYDKCLENIDLARFSSFDAKSAEKLKEIDEKCRELMKDKTLISNDNPWDFFKVTGQVHEKVPFIADCLKPHDTWKYGRCVITTKSLKTGDIVAIEEPLFKMLNKNSRYSRCAGCLKSNQGSLLPCPGKCTSGELR